MIGQFVTHLVVQVPFDARSATQRARVGSSGPCSETSDVERVFARSRHGSVVRRIGVSTVTDGTRIHMVVVDTLGK